MTDEQVAWTILKMMAIIQGGFTVGILVAIIFFMSKAYNKAHSYYTFAHVYTISISHLCLIIATCRTMWLNYYSIGDIWYWLVFSAYLTSDISLFIVVSKLMKNHEPRNSN